MQRTWFSRCAALGGALVLMGLLGLATPSLAQKDEWGAVKGTVVWAEKALPKLTPLDVNTDKEHCLSKGKLFDPFSVVNPKNKGVPYAMVWLTSLDKKDSPLPIHPDLKTPKSSKVVIDQPCCLFDPPVLGIREGQSWVVKNSAPVPHNANIIGGMTGPNLNPLIPPGGMVEIPAKELQARDTPISISCSIHRWMRGYARVFKHPYFTVTDGSGQFEIAKAPAGRYRLVIWHPNVGWVTGEGAEPDRFGRQVTIPAGGVASVGKIDMREPKD